MTMTKEQRVNLAFTILGPIVVSCLICWVKWSFDAKVDLKIKAQDDHIQSIYVTKETFRDESTKVDDLAKEVRQNFSSLQTQVGDVAKDVATMKGELSAKK
jgi:hypothetical protein